VGSDAVTSYGESAARSGAIGHIKGTEIMPSLVQAARGS
jgi:2,3-bisphosphoglycerate-independent phosphoglycerate mutase